LKILQTWKGHHNYGWWEQYSFHFPP
jgi:hypothetical protein